MRRGISLLVIVALLTLTVLSFYNDWPVLQQSSEKLIRFHVIANSDTLEDQAIKRAVRDRLIKTLGNQFAQAQSIEEAREIIRSNERLILEEAKQEVFDWGKSYEIKLAYGDFPFPTKSYGNFVLPAGEYEALKVIIGEGKGQNWWCVLFPPLCFVDISTSLAKNDAAPVMTGKQQAAKKVKVRLKLLEVLQGDKQEQPKAKKEFKAKEI